MAGKNLFDEVETKPKKTTKSSKPVNLFDEVEAPKPSVKPTAKPTKKPPIKPSGSLDLFGGLKTDTKKAEAKGSLLGDVGKFVKSIVVDIPVNTIKETSRDMKSERDLVKSQKKTTSTKEYADNFLQLIDKKNKNSTAARSAAAQNVLDTATFGIGTKAIDVVTSGKQTNALEESRKKYPGISAAAGLAGYSAPFKVAGKIVAPAVKKISNKVVKTGAKGFVEGALVGGAESSSRQAIEKGNVDVKEAGKSALLFGGLGTAGELLGGKLTGKFKNEPVRAEIPTKQLTRMLPARQTILNPRKATQGRNLLEETTGINFLDDVQKLPTKSADGNPISQFRTNTIERAKDIPDDIKSSVLTPDEFDYIPEKVKNWDVEAVKNVSSNRDAVISKIENSASIEGGTMAHEAAIISKQLLIEAEQTGNYAPFKSWLKTVSSKTRETARALKGTDTAWAKKSKEGAIMDAQRVVDNAEEAIKKTNPNKVKKINDEANAVTKAVDDAQNEAADQAIKELLPEEMLARKVSGTLNQGTKEPDAITDMVNELFKSAKESPLPERVASIKRDPIEFLKQAIQNKGQYTDVWEKAKGLLKEKYAAEPDALAMLDNYFEKGIVPTYSTSTLNSSVQKSMKQLQQDLKNIAKSSKVDKEKSLSALTEYLTKETGATADESIMLASKVQERFNTLVTEKSDQLLKQMFKNKPTKQQKTMFKKVQELINLGAYDKEAIRDLIKQREGLPILSGDDIKIISENMDKAAAFPDGSYQQRMLQQKAAQLIANKVPSTKIEKFQAAQRISMLLNPKSLVARNPLGNAILNTLEDVKNVPAAAIDKGVSAIRGSERTTILAPISKTKATAQGAKRGLSEWRKDIINKVDTSPAGGGVELPNKTKIFNEETGNAVSKNIAKSANKVHYVIGKALKLGDTPFYNAAYDKRIAELKIINKSEVVTDAMREDAMMFGLERTLQNDSATAALFTGLKEANFLNKHPEAKSAYQVIANLILPFAKTPANILSKFIDYTPAGALKATGKAIATVGKGTFNQKKFVDTMARSLTGTGLATLGYLLAQKGMVTGAKDKNKMVEAFETAIGKSNYAFKIGNDYYTVDWALPAAAPIMMGADIYKAIRESKNPTAALTDGSSSAVNLLFNSTLLQGPSRLLGGYNPAASIASGLLGTTTQATPTIGKQIAQLVDPINRETYSPDPIQNVINKTIARIPFASKSLPPKMKLTGEVSMAYDGDNSLFNVFLNPGFKTTEKKTAGINLLDDVYEATGDEGVIPKAADKTITYKIGKEEKKLQLTGSEFTQYQKLIGKADMRVANALSENEQFKTLSDEDKAKAIKSYFDKVHKAVKVKMLMDIAKERKK